jgi:hypothetical protein
MLVCYVPFAQFDDWDNDGPEQCFEFQNEDSKGSTTISRTMVGLPENSYMVGVINLDNG